MPDAPAPARKRLSRFRRVRALGGSASIGVMPTPLPARVAATLGLIVLAATVIAASRGLAQPPPFGLVLAGGRDGAMVAAVLAAPAERWWRRKSAVAARGNFCMMNS